MEPVICTTAAEGLAALENQRFDFICLSLFLTDGDGVELSRKIRALPKSVHTPIILFTANVNDDLYAQALSAGVTEVFHKQDVRQLVNFINRFTVQRQKMDGRILYIEDTASQREFVTKIFVDKGLSVDAFANASDALKAFKQNDYDLVVTDIVLEGVMSGMALINYIRRLDDEKGDVPILAVTGFDDISRRIELFYLGVSDYVIKPIIEEELLVRVRNLIKNKQFYQEALRQKKRAEEADQAKSNFIAQMSHELRTPMNAILGFSQLLLSDEEHPLFDEHKDYVGQITTAGNHLLGLINDILDLSKIESEKLELNLGNVNLAELVDKAVNQVKALADKKEIELLPFSIANESVVFADPVRLHQVILNLLSNAIKYNSDHGSVKILCKPLDDGMIRLAVKDTGRGMTEKQQQQLFQPFNRLGLGDDIEGAGLGLVICLRMIEAMGGKIAFKSKQGQGTTFWIDLPVGK